MESSKHNSSKRSLVEEDANISKFRRGNKIIIFVFVFLIISFTLIIAAFITELVRIHRPSHKQPVVIPPISAFCGVSDAPTSCLRALIPIINNTVILDPDQIFTLSLQTAADDLQNITSSILSDTSSTEFAFGNCSNSLPHGLGQLSDPLATMRENFFVGSLSSEQRGEMMERIVAAEQDVTSCLDDLAKVESAAAGVATAKLLGVKVYLNGARDFLSGYAKVLHNWRIIFNLNGAFPRGIIFDDLSVICMLGLQFLFMFGLFCSLFRIR